MAPCRKKKYPGCKRSNRPAPTRQRCSTTRNNRPRTERNQQVRDPAGPSQARCCSLLRASTAHSVGIIEDITRSVMHLGGFDLIVLAIPIATIATASDVVFGPTRSILGMRPGPAVLLINLDVVRSCCVRGVLIRSHTITLRTMNALCRREQPAQEHRPRRHLRQNAPGRVAQISVACRDAQPSHL